MPRAFPIDGAAARRRLPLRFAGAVVTGILFTASACAHASHLFVDSPPFATLSCRQSEASADAPMWSPANADGALAQWCATVGPVLYQPQPASAAPPPIDRLAIVSWNIHEGAGDVDEVVRRLRIGEFTGGEPVEQFVLLLQEATRSDTTVPQQVPRGAPSPRRIAPPRGRPDGDVHRFAGEGFAVLYAPSMRNGEREGIAEDRGNAIVSTVPLQQPRLIELPLQHQRRVAVMAAVAGTTSDGTAWRLDLVDVHLDTTLALWHGGPTAARRRQAVALIDALRAMPPAPVERSVTVLAGDFNSWLGARDGAVRLLREAFPGTVAIDRQPTWTGPLGVHATLDHILVRGASPAIRAIRLPGRFGSDHYPLLIVLDFRLHENRLSARDLRRPAPNARRAP
jgi:endonuclease/exonuclease/phosphatase family metal-dependent hydrolase